MNLAPADILEYRAPIAFLFSDNSVSEISVNPDLRVFIERSGKREEFILDVPLSLLKVQAVLRRIAHANHTAIDGDNPMLNAQFSDGSWICALYPPISPAGPMFRYRLGPEPDFFPYRRPVVAVPVSREPLAEDTPAERIDMPRAA